MSIATRSPYPCAAPATVISRIPGTTYARYSRGRRGDPPEAGAEGPAEDVHEEQQEHHGDAGDEDRQRGIAAHAAEAAPSIVAESARTGGNMAWSPRSPPGRRGPVRDRKTSSRSASRRRAPSTSIDGGVEPIEHRAQACTTAVARHLEGERLVVAAPRRAPRGAFEPGRRRTGAGCCPPGTSRFSSAACPCATSRPLSSTAIRCEPVGLLEVLGRQEDRDAAGDEVADDVPHHPAAARIEAAVGSSRKMIRGSPTSVIARSRRRRMPPE